MIPFDLVTSIWLLNFTDNVFEPAVYVWISCDFLTVVSTRLTRTETNMIHLNLVVALGLAQIFFLSGINATAHKVNILLLMILPCLNKLYVCILKDKSLK